MKNRIATLALLTAATSTVVAGCCLPDSGPQTLTSSDGLVQITVTNGMTKTSMMDNPDASLQVGNVFRELYALVISERKAELAPIPGLSDLDGYAEFVRDNNRSSMTNSNLTPVEETTIGGHPAKKWAVTGKMEDLELYFILAVIETDAHYHQVMTWTLESSKEKYGQVLDDVVESFRLAP